MSAQQGHTRLLPPACDVKLVLPHRSRLTLFGERDSGTNLLAALLRLNFNATADTSAGFKHLYGDEQAIFERLIAAQRPDLGVVLIVRELDAWLMAMYDNCHECKNMRGSNSGWRPRTFGEFLVASPWQSVNFNIRPPVALVGDRYADIFALRRSKLLAMHRLMSGTAAGVGSAVVRFEDLVNGTRAELCRLRRELRVPFHSHLHGIPQTLLSEARPFVHSLLKPGNGSRAYLQEDRTAAAIRCRLVDWNAEALFGYRKPASCIDSSPPPPPPRPHV